ncbi:MAG TPA: hypothetical protein VLZ72_03170, partial [Flavobacterium sp.]|nr:hypothetical protein [Flavobacterium sp.]
MTAPSSLQQLYKEWAGEAPLSITLLPPSGSYRSYYRMTSKNSSVLGAVNYDVSENIAFIEFTRFFESNGLRVPTVFAVDEKKECYLLEDLGNQTLFDLLSTERHSIEIP